MQWIAYGPNALLLRFADAVGDAAFERGRALAAALEREPPPGLVGFVPALTSILLEFERLDSGSLPQLGADLIRRLDRVAAVPLPPSTLVEIPVTYDGPDLERVASHHGLSVAEVAPLHAQTLYKVYMLGFTPGFPYLGDLDPRLHTPRLASPRKKVPAGAVAIGGQHTGIYSVEGPGGWNIIGHTDLLLFDPERGVREGDLTAAFLLKPGFRVKFIATRR